MKLACLVTAAGSGSRFGEDKLLLPIAGQPMGVHALEVLSKASFALRVLVTSEDKGYRSTLSFFDHCREADESLQECSRLHLGPGGRRKAGESGNFSRLTLC